MDIQLYYAPITCALAPYITLTEAGAEFEAVPLNFRKQQHMSAEYMAINPKHKVPLLVVDGKKLTENVAIQQWIARTFPEANLLPSDPWDELQAVSLVSWCSSGIHPYLRVINGPPKVCDIAGTEENIRNHAAEHVFECFQIAEVLLDGKEYFFDRFTAPDTNFYWCFRRAGQFELDLSPFKNCQAHFDRMETRPSVQKLLAFEKEIQAEFAKAA
jgi:glutathione S-transferase